MPSLHWIGKEKVQNHHLEVPIRVLQHAYRFEANEKADGAGPAPGAAHKIIHGDNLEALKALLPEYEGRVKCIYIDPPYNTGNEGWVYNDNVNDPKLKKWLHQVVGKEGDDLSRHDKWLCMMYPRLQLLHRLLAEDGAIFISIDDNEQASLKLVMDEIFGLRNFITNFTWKTEGNFDNQAKVKINHEYIVFYFKNKNLFNQPSVVDPNIDSSSKLFRGEIRNTVVKNGPKNPISEIKLPPGFPAEFETGVIPIRSDSWPYFLNECRVKDYKIENWTTVKSGWSSKELLTEYISNGFNEVLDTKRQWTRFVLTKSGAIENIKRRGNPSHVVSSLQNFGSTQNQSSELKTANLDFDYPKPVPLVEYLLAIGTTKDSIVLDSFAGSGTTLHAVLNLNRDGGQRQCILVEMEDYAETITAERVRRVMNGYADKPGTGGCFDYYTLGERIFTEDEELNEAVPLEALRQYIWYSETKTAYQAPPADMPEAYLGMHQQAAYYFYWKPGKATTLNLAWLKHLVPGAALHVVYADNCTLSKAQLDKYKVIFKKIPRDISKK